MMVDLKLFISVESHDLWYNNPWVNTDVLMLLLFKADPLERGLEKYRFSSDYEGKLHEVVTRHRGDFMEIIQTEDRN